MLGEVPQAGGADLVCRTSQFMIRVARRWTPTSGSMAPGGCPGGMAVPVGRWTHLAITWDQATRMVGIYVNGQLDMAQEPEGISEAELGERACESMRLGGHTWQANPIVLDGQLDEVRISAVARQYRGGTGQEKAGRRRHAGGIGPREHGRESNR